MALFGRGTTPYLPIYAEGVDLTGAHVYVTIKQNATRLIKDGADVTFVGYDSQTDTSELAVSYTQKETLGLADGAAELQIRWIYSDGTAQESDIAQITIGRVLQGGVIVYA